MKGLGYNEKPNYDLLYSVFLCVLGQSVSLPGQEEMGLARAAIKMTFGEKDLLALSPHGQLIKKDVPKIEYGGEDVSDDEPNEATLDKTSSYLMKTKVNFFAKKARLPTIHVVVSPDEEVNNQQEICMVIHIQNMK